ncbi:unnamed protein product [Polarella glacialis]|uniref:Uncharacterized protein n=1 Tax=Polarella glacialis TaxID=89957 RepID=A0A813LYD8_POLGL|nr:unnamed protein product [Polarella glacialis]
MALSVSLAPHRTPAIQRYGRRQLRRLPQPLMLLGTAVAVSAFAVHDVFVPSLGALESRRIRNAGSMERDRQGASWREAEGNADCASVSGSDSYVGGRGSLVRTTSASLVLAGLGLFGEFPASASLDGVPDIANLAVGRKKYVPKIVEGYKLLTAAGAVDDAWLSKLPKLSKAMDLWGALQRREMVPDKISRRLQKDVVAFEKVARTKDYTATVQAFERYMEDLPDVGPGGSAKIDLANSEGPPLL